MGGSLEAASQHMGALAATTGALLATVGTRTCLLRRGRRMSESDRAAAVDAVVEGAARSALTSVDAMTVEDGAAERDETTPVPDVVATPEPVIRGEVVAVTVATSTTSLPPPTPPSRSSSLKTFHSAPSTASPTASLHSVASSFPARNFVIRVPDPEFEDDYFGDDASGSSGTLGDEN